MEATCESRDDDGEKDKRKVDRVSERTACSLSPGVKGRVKSSCTQLHSAPATAKQAGTTTGRALSTMSVNLPNLPILCVSYRMKMGQ